MRAVTMMFVVLAACGGGDDDGAPGAPDALPAAGTCFALAWDCPAGGIPCVYQPTFATTAYVGLDATAANFNFDDCGGFGVDAEPATDGICASIDPMPTGVGFAGSDQSSALMLCRDRSDTSVATGATTWHDMGSDSDATWTVEATPVACDSFCLF